MKAEVTGANFTTIENIFSYFMENKTKIVLTLVGEDNNWVAGVLVHYQTTGSHPFLVLEGKGKHAFYLLHAVTGFAVADDQVKEDDNS